MQKYKPEDIKPFSFSDIKGPTSPESSGFVSFQFGEISGNPYNHIELSQDQIRSERHFAKENQFKIDSVVKDSRGLSDQELSDFENRVQQEVSLRLKEAYQEAYSKGLEAGKNEGMGKAYQDQLKILETQVENFGEIIEYSQNQTQSILNQHYDEIYEFVKRFTKWVVLKEIDESKYLESLLEKLILELNSRKNLIIKVGKSNFNQMPEVLKLVETRVGQLINTRIEIVPEISYPGIILESENGLIDGSLEQVFRNIDKIFESNNPGLKKNE